MEILASSTLIAESRFSRIVATAISRSASIGRNNACFDMACQLRDNGFTQVEAEHAAGVFACSVGDRTYTLREAISSVRSAYRRPPREAWPGISSHNSLSSQLVQAQRLAEFRCNEFRRLMSAARDRRQIERIVRQRAFELTQESDFASTDWEVIDHYYAADQEADELVAAADWIQTTATDGEIRTYLAEVSR